MRRATNVRPMQLQRRQRGTVAVEFAIIGVWLVFMLGAIIETGLFLLVESQLQNAADRMGRSIRTNQLAPGSSASSFKTVLCSMLKMTSCDTKIYIDVRNADSFENLSLSLPFKVGNVPNVGPGGPEVFEPGVPGRAGSLIITYDWTFIFPFMQFFSNQTGPTRRLYGLSVYRIEG